MKSKTRVMMFFMTILMVLALSAFWTLPALADDEVPPPVPTSEPAQPPDEVPPLEEASSVEQPPADVPAVEIPAAKEIPPTEVPVVEETLPEETAPVEETVAELLTQIPEGTELVVVNEAGETVPLVTQEAADAIAIVDPVWCPAGVAPKTDATGGCTTSYASLKLLVDALMTGTAGVVPGTNGVIWIQSGADASAGAILLDGTDASLGTMETFSLTLQGGWNGVHGSTTVSLLTPSTFTQSLSITNWQGMITLNNITFSGVITGSASNNAALNVHTTKNVILNNVNTNANTGASVKGVHIDNDEGTVVSAVNVNTSNINSNNGAGLTIFSDGIITLKDVTASNNGADGIFLNNTAGSAVGIVFSGATIAADNGGDGIEAYSDGAITASNLVANSNNLRGAVLNNSSALTALGVTLSSSSNQFKFNGSTGLTILSNGAITLNSITSNNNASGNGAYLDNDGFLNGSANVTLTGTNTFEENYGSGLEVYSDGIVTLSNIAANDNGLYGLYVDNSGASTPKAVTLSVSGSIPDNTLNNNYSGGLVILSKGAITATGVGADGNTNGNGVTLKNDYPGAVGGITIAGWGLGAGGNNGYGLNASSLGAITISHLWTFGNTLYGATLDNSTGTGAVTITGESGFGNNSGDGLIIHSKGAITLGAMFAETNSGAGVILDNSFGTQNVTLNGAHHDFNNNIGSGLEVYSYGMITITNLYAFNNGSFGALLDNCLQTVPGTCTTGTAKTVTLNGNNNVVERNGNTGLDITSKGIITTNNLIARDNGGFGAFFDNQMTGAVGTINIKNAPTFWAEFARNGRDGLKLHSNGTITVMDLDAYQNGQNGNPAWGYGVYLDNASGGGVGNIVLGTSRAGWFNGLNENFLSGLEVYTNGTVTINNVMASGNGLDNLSDPVYGYGAFLNTYGALKAVVLNGTNRFNGNSTGGLYINSLGAITLNNIGASGNGFNSGGGDGANLNNSSAGTPQLVTLKGNNSFYGNYNNGLQVISKGAITVNNIISSSNGDGAELYNTASGTGSPQNVTLTGFGDFYGNYNNGLDIYSFGVITLNNVNANDNGQNGGLGYGAYVDNYTGNTQIKAVTLNGYNSFYNNFTGGLEIHSLGAIIVNNMDASTNTGFGALLDNNDGSTPSAVTILGGAYTADNGGYGLQVTTKGAITINVIDAWVGNNTGYGWNLDNSFSGSVGGITMTSPNPDWAFDFWSNGTYGLWAQSRGSITITGLDVTENGTFGATLDNAFVGSVGTITITVPALGNNNLSGNLGDGLLVYSNRAITSGGLNANDNGGAGVILDNTSSSSASLQNVTLTGNNDFHNNGDTGLVVDTYGAITLNNITANDNGQNGGLFGWGAWLDNCGYDTGSCVATTPKAITLNGTNNFHGNHQDGLWATSLGAIKINAPSANLNDANGVNLNNQWSNAIGGITITASSAINWNSFNNNGALGLNAYSGGLITLSNIMANGNIGGGAYIDTFNDDGPSANVILSGRNVFNYNGDGIIPGGTDSGLVVNATGTIALNNVTAIGNAASGAILDNLSDLFYSPVPTPGLKLTGVNNFSGNGADGLYFYAYGNIELNKVTADNNGANGIDGWTDGAVAGNITLTCGSMTNNGAFGWQLRSTGNSSTTGLVTLKGVFAFGNLNPLNTNLIDGTLVTVRTCPLP